ncbi:DUF262 domain-containing protein [Pseudoflavitalea sp. X16]|uniref:DUF262 domain-containing protein n=1 Tax=Paraflavitalea devenefica TaxID=2716334 RepID=UPI00142087EA|nr:DUF262 domain-containing protein [Paraflavitalea devenefica]NII26196.1 DUF262 domain-containing protein [Paraflavitalea devenefica]
MAIWKPYRVSEIIADIEEEKFVLPVIQRRLVWNEEKMIELFDTLLKGDSFGGIIVIEEEKGESPLFNYRPFSKGGEVIASREVNTLSQSQYFVIDGQQRLQTFYIGLKGSYNGKVLYFDLFSDYRQEFEFTFEQDSNKLPKHSKDNGDRTIADHNWYLAASLLKRLRDTNDEDQVASEIIKKQGVTDDTLKEHITKNVKAFYKNILGAEAVGVSKVSVNTSYDETMNRQKIVELFRRLNMGGTVLSPFDLVASIMKGYNWEMEGFLEKTLADFKDIGLTQDNLIKFIFLLRDNHIKELADIEAADAKFAIDKRERITATLSALRSFLQEADLYNYYKEGNRSFIPLFFIAYHVFHLPIADDKVEGFFDNADANHPNYPLMKKWMYYSLLNGVFRSKGAGWIPYRTGIKKILGVIQHTKGGLFPIEELFDVYYEHGVTFTEELDVTKLDSFESQFLFYLIYDRKQVIRIQDIDHIMPKSLLEGKYEWHQINSMANFQLLDYGTNRGEKNAKPFREWIDNHVTDKNAFVHKHLIPADVTIWDEEAFVQFITARAGLIFKKVTQYIIGDPIVKGALPL